jgi:hypothetical protein
MTNSWYFISILREGEVIFNGFFSVDNTTNLITSIYETINGSTNFNNNILSPLTFPPPYDYYTADNIFNSNTLSFSNTGCNFTSVNLQNTLEKSVPYFNLYSYIDDIYYPAILFALDGGDITTNILITPITDPSCYNEGTKILCLNKMGEEEYIPIENLRKGDLVKSYKHGYRKIELIGKKYMINNPSIFNKCMYKMEKTNENGLIEDLIVTGGHCILVDNLGSYKKENDKLLGSRLMIDDKYLLLSSVSNKFIKLDNTNLYTYYHFILENKGDDNVRYGVWANGILTETPSKKQFIKHKYTLL